MSQGAFSDRPSHMGNPIGNSFLRADAVIQKPFSPKAMNNNSSELGFSYQATNTPIKKSKYIPPLNIVEDFVKYPLGTHPQLA